MQSCENQLTILDCLPKSNFHEAINKMEVNNACDIMIKQQLRTNGIVDDKIISLYKQIPRTNFVPTAYQAFAYTDLRIPLNFAQCMLTPLEEATILQALTLTGVETILEIGTGSGFFTALLSQCCKKIYTVDYFELFTQTAKEHFHKFNLNNIECFTGDASDAWDVHAPYDAVIYTGALPQLTETQRLQITPGGQLIAFIGDHNYAQAKHYKLDHNSIWHEQLLFTSALPSLIMPETSTTQFVF